MHDTLTHHFKELITVKQLQNRPMHVPNLHRLLIQKESCTLIRIYQVWIKWIVESLIIHSRVSYLYLRFQKVLVPWYRIFSLQKYLHPTNTYLKPKMARCHTNIYDIWFGITFYCFKRKGFFMNKSIATIHKIGFYLPNECNVNSYTLITTNSYIGIDFMVQ